MRANLYLDGALVVEDIDTEGLEHLGTRVELDGVWYDTKEDS